MLQKYLLHRLIIILTIYSIGCTAHQKLADKSITCYDCNSEYDPRCGDPFNPHSIGQVNCSLKPPHERLNEPPTICRKTVQMVQGNLRVIRGCGYIRDERDDKECIKRSGTHEVRVTYCSCSSNLCNGIEHIKRPSYPILLITVYFINYLICD